MRLNRNTFGTRASSKCHQTRAEVETASEHVEHVNKSPVDADTIEGRPKYPFQAECTDDADLPFIPAAEIEAQANAALLEDIKELRIKTNIWIVVDSIVYDCTQFVHDHPGGVQVIRSFSGQDCSWQFWRFHDRALMQQQGGH